jgi:hypothetical protein
VIEKRFCLHSLFLLALAKTTEPKSSAYKKSETFCKIAERRPLSYTVKACQDVELKTRQSLIERLRNRLRNRDDRESWREFFNRYWKLIYRLGDVAE